MEASRIIKGIKFRGNEFRSLKPVLEAWQSCIEQYVKLFKGNDAPYWHNERANISVLAGAAWKTPKFIALEEYGTHKVRNGARGRGRADLYIANNKHEWAFEAKCKRGEIDNNKKWKSNQIHDSAAADAKCITDCENKVALVFCIPSIPNTKQAQPDQIGQFIDMLEKFPDNFTRHHRATAVAWCFPKSAWRTRYNHAIYPGILLTATLLKPR